MSVLTCKCECCAALQLLARAQLSVHASVGPFITRLSGRQDKGAIEEELAGWKELAVVEPLQGNCCCGRDGAVEHSRSAHCYQHVLWLFHKLCNTRHALTHTDRTRGIV